MCRDLIWARENLTDRGHERLHTAFAYDWFDDPECAWTVEEMLRDLHRSPNQATAQAELADWYRCAGIHDIAQTNRLAKTLHAWEPEILAFFDTGLTNGPTEGHNLIVKTVKRQGFGYTNPDHYRLRVLYRCS